MGAPERAAQVQSEPLPQVLVPKRWHPPKNTEVFFLKVELCVRSLTCAWRKGPSSCLPQPDQNSLSFLRWLPGLPSAYLACLGGWVWLLTLLISGARAWDEGLGEPCLQCALGWCPPRASQGQGGAQSGSWNHLSCNCCPGPLPSVQVGALSTQRCCAHPKPCISPPTSGAQGSLKSCRADTSKVTAHGIPDLEPNNSVLNTASLPVTTHHYVELPTDVPFSARQQLATVVISGVSFLCPPSEPSKPLGPPD